MRDDEKDPRSESATAPLSRRELLQIGATAALVTPLAGKAARASGLQTAIRALSAGRFFTAAEMALLDELSEMILPTDEHSPGARAAGVAAYIDDTLSQKDPKIEDHARERQAFRDGLARVEALSRSMHDRAFLEATPQQRLAVLESMAQNEGDPKTPEQVFFGELKRSTAYAYYTSEVGIHQEMEYLGNTVLRNFVGTDVSRG